MAVLVLLLVLVKVVSMETKKYKFVELSTSKEKVQEGF